VRNSATYNIIEAHAISFKTVNLSESEHLLYSHNSTDKIKHLSYVSSRLLAGRGVTVEQARSPRHAAAGRQFARKRDARYLAARKRDTRKRIAWNRDPTSRWEMN